jgi:capsular exopolysaccharide synthesis family protein
MSHIFDALQRSEADRSDAKSTVHATVTELLERAERQARLQRDTEEISTVIGEVGRSSTTFGETPEVISSDSLELAALGIGEAVCDEERTQICESFKTLEVSLPLRSRLVCLTDKESPAAEAFRLLRVRLRHLRRDRILKKLLITSTSPEEGKSFAAANLACTLASASQERILLLEGDLRRPVLSKMFGVDPKSGICEVMSGKSTLSSSIYRLEGPGIWILPAGSAHSDPMEIIQSPKLSSVIQQVAKWFDWIIIDSPPALPLADTTTLARMADGILLVVRRGTTEKRKLEKGLEAFEANKLLGAILNSSDSAADKDYYYYRQKPEGSGPMKAIS